MSEQQQRDELAEIIQDCGEYIPGSHADDYVSPDKAAAAILAAGYRKPSTITSAEELRALPVRSVIRGKWLAEKWADEIGELWYVAGKGMRWDTEQLVQRGALPATVLFDPEAQS